MTYQRTHSPRRLETSEVGVSPDRDREGGEIADSAGRWPFGTLERGAYRVIYADAPYWFSSGPNRNPRNHYQCMRDAELVQLPVKELAHPEGARLFMWTTVPVLSRALAIMGAWGFKYSSARVWVKLRRGADPQNVTPDSLAIGTAYEVRGCAELLLIGKLRTPERLGNPKPISVCFAERREHSRKPDEIRDEIAPLFRGPRIELFARSRAPGWDAWGNEVGKFDDSPAAAFRGRLELEERDSGN